MVGRRSIGVVYDTGWTVSTRFLCFQLCMHGLGVLVTACWSGIWTGTGLPTSRCDYIPVHDLSVTVIRNDILPNRLCVLELTSFVDHSPGHMAPVRSPHPGLLRLPTPPAVAISYSEEGMPSRPLLGPSGDSKNKNKRHEKADMHKKDSHK
jgi:hypothetical protein